jgi:hypothetical protein
MKNSKKYIFKDQIIQSINGQLNTSQKRITNGHEIHEKNV